MDYCGPLGIPHSAFLEWSEVDREKALAWKIDQSLRCNQCGSYPNEWDGPDGRPVLPPPMFVRSYRCRGCVTLHQEEDSIRAGSSNNTMPPGMRVYLSRQPPPPRDDDEDDT